MTVEVETEVEGGALVWPHRWKVLPRGPRQEFRAGQAGICAGWRLAELAVVSGKARTS